MEFVKTRKLHVNLKDNQYDLLKSKGDIKPYLGDKNVLLLDVVKHGNIIGFAMIKDDIDYISILDFAIDINYQNKGLGFKALKDLFEFIKKTYNKFDICCQITNNNFHAIHVFLKAGFIKKEDIYRIDLKNDNMKNVLSCGAVTYTKINGEIKYLIIKSLDDGTYGFPKGRNEKEETLEETALRETKEEVGVNVILDKKFKYVDEYLIPKGKTNYNKDYDILKKVIFYIGYYENQTPKKQDSELESLALMSYNEAISVLKYQSQRQILNEVNKYLLNN